ncbi:MAG: hypothetical protein HQ582_19535 [Planctomycetes bacterium]|nr:hypothetical protein [Planctomycetota bacterium]
MNSPLKATETFNVADLAAMLSDAGPLNVVVDYRALEDVGVYDEKILTFGMGRMSLRNYARFLLRQLDLVLVEEPHRLLITTPEEVEYGLETEVYPVADLLHLDRVADEPLLAHPYLDHNERSRREIESRLKRPVTIDFQDFPLNLAVAHFAEVLGSTMLVDLRALDNVGMDLRATRVTGSWKDVPAKDSLRWILDPLDLDYTIRGDAVIITTPEEIEMELSVRLHSARGLVYGETVTAEERTQRRQARWGGMGGGFGGGMGGFSPWDSSNAGLSASGDADTEASEQEADDVGLPPAPPSLSAPPPASMVDYDSDSIIEQVTTTVQPETWDDVGGAGSIVFFEPTLDLVFAQTDSAHDEIEALFNRLRALPTEMAEDSRLVALDKPVAEPGRDPRAYLEDLIDMLTTTVDPEDWDYVGGACSLGADRSRLALIASATADTHDGVAQLLTMLRRSRWEALRSTRPWETGTVWSTTTGRESPTLAALPTGLRLSDLAEPEPGELEALSVRRGPKPGVEAWRRAASGGAPPTTLVLRQSDDRTEIQMPDGTLRIDAEAAAVACPSLGVVELGDWGEAARRMLDVWLPWMPHRTNEELARLYSVQAISSDDNKKGATNAVRLRLIPQGLSESAKTYLEIDYSAKTGLVAGWQSFRGGELVGRMSFGKAAPPSGLPAVTWKNASGGTRMVWELLESKPLDEKLAELSAGWDGFLLLDRRSEEPSVDAPFRAALDAVSQRQWSQAAAQADAALKQHLSHPLLLLLKAWCYENDPRLGSQPQQLKLLEEVAKSRATSLAHFVADGNFSWLSSEQLYRLLTLVPPDARTAANCDDLARAAVATGELEIALKHTDAADAIGGLFDAQFVRYKRRIELLLKLGRPESAAQAARQSAQNPEISPERLADMAELIASHGQDQLAGEMFDQALGRQLSVDVRYALLRRRAGTLAQEGLPRWRALLAAALVYPADSLVRQQTMSTLLAELHLPAHAEVAGVLAQETDDPVASAQLVLRQAELTADPGQAADICRRLLALGRIPPERRTWALGVWNKASRPQDTIRAAEDWLRNDPVHTDELLRYELAAAYGTVGRVRDARRAASTDAARRIRSTPRESGGLF